MDIICKCGHKAQDHYDCGCQLCACQNEKDEIYLTLLARQDAVIEAARKIVKHRNWTSEKLYEAITALDSTDV